MAKNLNYCMLLDFYGDILTEKQRELVQLYYNDDLSLGEIAENEGITRQGVHDSIKRSESILLEMEQKLKLAERFQDISLQLKQIADYAEKISEENREFCYSTTINANARMIFEIATHMRY